jgi:hypothetical protein
MWEDANYCWVVLCKNHWFHMRQNFFFRHRVPLAETDTVSSLPSLGKRFTVRCDECGKTYTYKPKDVLRVELELPESFRPHPLFRDCEDEVLRIRRAESVPSDSRELPQEEPRQEEPSQERQKRAKTA